MTDPDFRRLVKEMREAQYQRLIVPNNVGISTTEKLAVIDNARRLERLVDQALSEERKER
jgi:hypothetical protein